MIIHEFIFSKNENTSRGFSDLIPSFECKDDFEAYDIEIKIINQWNEIEALDFELHFCLYNKESDLNITEYFAETLLSVFDACANGSDISRYGIPCNYEQILLDNEAFFNWLENHIDLEVYKSIPYKKLIDVYQGDCYSFYKLCRFVDILSQALFNKDASYDLQWFLVDMFNSDSDFKITVND